VEDLTMRVGFTGNRYGMSIAQEEAFIALFGTLCAKVFHHGACVGSDALAAHHVVELFASVTIIAHPGRSAFGGDNEYLDRESLRFAFEVRPEKRHFARNRDIVNETAVLIATPGNGDPITPATKGGTAYTVNYARKLGRPIAIVRPDGTVEYERWTLTPAASLIP
jgi:hypothetical protein